MKAIILAAGYANRLRSVTNDGAIAKTLLPIEIDGKGQPILYFLLDKIKRTKDISETIVISNQKYYKQIKEACENYPMDNISIISNGTKDPSEAKGANADLSLALELLNDSNEDVLVLASDNYFEFELDDLVKYYNSLNEFEDNVNIVASKKYPESMKSYIADKFGILDTSSNKKVVSLDEKPGIENIKTTNVSLALYIFNREDFNKLDTFLDIYKDDKKKRDSLGYFINYMIHNTNMYTYEFDTAFYDIGTPDEYYQIAYKEENKVY